MAVYTWNPIPTFEARQINNQEDGDAWAASLTPNELEDAAGEVSFTNVRIELDEATPTFHIRWTRNDTLDGSVPYEFVAPLGGYAIASRTSLNLWAEPEEQFLIRFQQVQ